MKKIAHDEIDIDVGPVGSKLGTVWPKGLLIPNSLV